MSETLPELSSLRSDIPGRIENWFGLHLVTDNLSGEILCTADLHTLPKRRSPHDAFLALWKVVSWSPPDEL